MSAKPEQPAVQYPWPDAPPEATHAATSFCGCKRWYKGEPRIDEVGLFWNGNIIRFFEACGPESTCEHWRETLQQRPQRAADTIPSDNAPGLSDAATETVQPSSAAAVAKPRKWWLVDPRLEGVYLAFDTQPNDVKSTRVIEAEPAERQIAELQAALIANARAALAGKEPEKK